MLIISLNLGQLLHRDKLIHAYLQNALLRICRTRRDLLILTNFVVMHCAVALV